MYYASRAEREKTYFEDIGREKSKNNAEEVLSALSALLSASDYFSACALPCPGFSAKERAKRTIRRRFPPISPLWRKSETR